MALTICRQCKKKNITCLEVALRVYEIDGVTILTDRLFCGCQQCFDEMDSYVKWYVKNNSRAVGVYACDRKKDAAENVAAVAVVVTSSSIIDVEKAKSRAGV